MISAAKTILQTINIIINIIINNINSLINLIINIPRFINSINELIAYAIPNVYIIYITLSFTIYFLYFILKRSNS